VPYRNFKLFSQSSDNRGKSQKTSEEPKSSGHSCIGLALFFFYRRPRLTSCGEFGQPSMCCTVWVAEIAPPPLRAPSNFHSILSVRCADVLGEK